MVFDFHDSLFLLQEQKFSKPFSAPSIKQNTKILKSRLLCSLDGASLYQLIALCIEPGEWVS
jgi:hypothetical protein